MLLGGPGRPPGWQRLANRHQRLVVDEFTPGMICPERDSSELTVARIFPRVGRRLLAHCLNPAPVHFEFGSRPVPATEPDASILLAIGGRDRIAQFELVLASLRGQTGVSVEIIVVEQGSERDLEATLPSDVRYIHVPGCEAGFNKGWALNVAARAARGRFLFVHDGDYVVAHDYVAQTVAVLEGVEAVRPARFIFHLDKTSTEATVRSRELGPGVSVDRIIQNNPTPIAVRAETYVRMGGHDESFFGWGGEDVEFLDRLRLGSVGEGGWLPVVHLWHAAAPKKASGDRNLDVQRARLAMPARQRARTLAALPWGDCRGPVVAP